MNKNSPTLLTGIILFSIIALVSFVLYDMVLIEQLKEPIKQLFQYIVIEKKQVDYLPFVWPVVSRFLLIFLSFYLILFLSGLLETAYEFCCYRYIAKEYGYRRYSFIDVLFKSADWSKQRTWITLQPLLTFATVFITCCILGFYCFSFFCSLAGFNVGISTFLFATAGLFMLSFFLYSLFQSLYRFLISSFGTEIAISEPELEDQTILKRSKKLVASQPGNLILLGLNYSYGIVLFTQLVFVLLKPALFSAEYAFTWFLIVLCNLVAWSIMKYFKVAMYVDSLLNYYSKVTFDKEFATYILK